mmetsp:Transcript_20654/g.48744  ORF Transcript_20654/g.48744 Transcript_20654/m.48744 type:complete len:547 (+) Transcript_20654:40-1680(+)
MLDTYYVVLISWVMNAFFDSWSEDAPWNNEDLTGDDAVGYFLTKIIGNETVGEDQKPSRLVTANVLYTMLTWFIIFLCVAWGVKWTGRIAYFTMGLPIVLLFVFLFAAVGLEGSSDGIREYIGVWDMSILSTRGEVWSIACSQIFFSISLTFGILTAFGSHCPRSEPAALNATVISLANSLFSIISGFAVFAALGHLAHLAGDDTGVKDLSYSGFGLVFGTWPVVFNKLPGGVHWVRLIFFNLFLLGIDSAFAFLEAFITVLHDTVYFQNVSRFWLALGVSCVGFLFSIIYCTDAGLYFLDVIDFYINFVMILVGFFEAFGSAWAYDIIGQFERQGKPVVYLFMTANFGAVILGCILWYSLPADHAVWGGFVGYILWYFVFLGATIWQINKVVASSDGKWTTKSMLWEVYFGNITSLRDRMQDVIGSVPFIWCVLMKHFIPHVLIVLFVNLAQSKNADGNPTLGNYSDYPNQPYQVLGIIVVAFTLVLFFGGVFFPDLYAPLALPQTAEAKEELEKYAAGTDSAVSEEVKEKEKDLQISESIEKEA